MHAGRTTCVVHSRNTSWSLQQEYLGPLAKVRCIDGNPIQSELFVFGSSNKPTLDPNPLWVWNTKRKCVDTRGRQKVDTIYWESWVELLPAGSILEAPCFEVSGRLEYTRPCGTLRAIAMGVDLRSNAIDISHALRASERATQFTGRFQADPRPIS